MKAFAVLAPHSAGRVPVHDACRVRLHGVEVDFAIVEQADITMDAADPRHAHDVLLQIRRASSRSRGAPTARVTWYSVPNSWRRCWQPGPPWTTCSRAIA
jgi:hypothetical protein